MLSREEGCSQQHLISRAECGNFFKSALPAHSKGRKPSRRCELLSLESPGSIQSLKVSLKVRAERDCGLLRTHPAGQDGCEQMHTVSLRSPCGSPARRLRKEDLGSASPSSSWVTVSLPQNKNQKGVGCRAGQRHRFQSTESHNPPPPPKIS